MPRIVSIQPDAVSSADLGHYAYRLDIGVTMWRNTPAFSLVYRYPPGSAGTYRPTDGQFHSFASGAVLSLARVKIGIAETTDALQRIVDVCLDEGDLDKNIERMTEAYQLFRNEPRLREDRLEAAISESAEILRLFWELRRWMQEGMVERRDFAVQGTSVICLP